MNKSHKFYSVLVLNVCCGNGKQHDLYQEELYLVKAKSELDCLNIIKKEFSSFEESYTASNNKKVTWLHLGIIDLKELDEEKSLSLNEEIICLYTRHFRNISSYKKIEPLFEALENSEERIAKTKGK